MCALIKGYGDTHSAAAALSLDVSQVIEPALAGHMPVGRRGCDRERADRSSARSEGEALATAGALGSPLAHAIAAE